MVEKESGSRDPKKKESMKEKMESALDKIKQDEQVKRGVNWIWDHRFALFAMVLMLFGLILSFYYVHIGGCLVGLALGIAFFKEIECYFMQLRNFYSSQGTFKTVMLIGGVLYFLIALPIFIIALAIGFAAVYVMHWLGRK